MTKTVNRREILAAGAAALIAARRGSAARPSAAVRPNIVYIMADDMGYADASCYGAPTIRTPAIDRLAAGGVRLTQAYANSAVCSATRTALMTGRYQDRIRVGLEQPQTTNPVGLPPEHPTLPSLLKRAGYATTLIGKWHLGALPDYDPMKSGYDHFYGNRGGGLDYYTHQANGRPDLWDGSTRVEEAGYYTDLLGKRAVDVVQGYARSGAPFLLSLHFTAPHWPWEAPGDQAESDRVAAKLKGGNATGRPMLDLDGGTLKTYAGMVEAMDRQVGRVLDALDKSGLASNTIVIFTSDNGGERFSNVWPFTGMKTELLEGGLRIPAIIRWPGHLPRNTVSEQVAITMDWVPTLLAAAGVAADPAYPLDGINLLPILAGASALQSRTLYWRYKANGQRAIRDGQYKALKMADSSFLFNVVDDPLERANLKDREPDTFHRLTAKWDAWNRSMLPEQADTYTDNVTGAELANHINTPAVDPRRTHNDDPWP